MVIACPRLRNRGRDPKPESEASVCGVVCGEHFDVYRYFRPL